MRKSLVQRLEEALAWLDTRPPRFGLALILLLTLVLHGHAVPDFWTHDDPLILKEVILHTPVEYFFEPRAWQELTAVSFSPLLTLSHELDYTLFGLEPAAFYAHQLVSVALAAYAFYRLLILWVPGSFALFGAILLLSSAPMALASSWLAIRHYVEGLALALFAMTGWVEALRGSGHKNGRIWLSAGLYLLAMLAKEVYVPFAALAMLLPEKTWKERARSGWPLWAVLVLYLAWRVWMLDGHFGGYGLLSINWENAPGLVLLAFLLLPLNYCFNLFGLNWTMPVWFGLFVAAVVVWMRHQGPKALGLAVSIFLLVSLPLLPVIGGILPDQPPVQLRFVMLPSVVILFAIVFGLSRWTLDRRSRVLSLLILGLLGLGLWVRATAVRAAWDDPPRQKLEARLLLYGDSSRVALSVAKPDESYFYRGLHWLRTRTAPGEAPAAVYGGYFRLGEGAAPANPALRFYGHDPRCDCLRDVTAAAQTERRRLLDRLSGRPLHARLNWGSGWLAWSLGPYDTGRYFLLSGERPDWYSSRRVVPRRGSLAYLMEGYMRVGYESPEGWIALSPEFRVDLTRPGRFEWSVDGAASNQLR